MTNSHSDGGFDGIQVQLRMLISHPPEQRFDADGAELMQLRGRVVDLRTTHPQVVVRFGGQRRAELFRWAKPSKHLMVEGSLEVKTWSAGGRQRVVLLIDAPLDLPARRHGP